MKTYLFLCSCFYVCSTIDQDQNHDTRTLLKEIGGAEALNGTLQRMVKTYHCAVDYIRNEKIILYGTKAWSFPLQDVNLTLRYPTTNPENYNTQEDFIITGLLVVLHIDGTQSRGYVHEGGILRDHIGLTFMITNITRLSYQFWLYGVKKNYMPLVSESSWQQNLC